MIQTKPSFTIIKQLELGSMQNYIYLIGDKVTRKAAVVDPAWDIPEIIKTAKELELDIEAILVTHDHPDHTNGIEELLTTYNVPIYLSKTAMLFFFPNS
ncbi:MBL fold metallo-hydrolase, partial [Candidatus Margulisiibacteriota bacterium]